MKQLHANYRKATVLLAIIFLILFSGCAVEETNETSSTITSQDSLTEETSISSSNNQSEKDMAMNVFSQFLRGEIVAIDPMDIDFSDRDFCIKEKADGYLINYGYYDMNEDGIPELHLKPTSGGEYLIFECQNNQVVLWYSDGQYSSPLINGAIWYCRLGIPNYYKYITLKNDGSVLSSIEFFGGYDYPDTEIPECYQSYLTIEKAPIDWTLISIDYEIFTLCAVPCRCQEI